MKEKFLSSSLRVVKKSNPNIDEDDLDVIRYGLESLYITITKITIIMLLAYILGVLKEAFLIMIFFNVVRCVAFGMHANKSIHCYIISSTLFIGGALISKYMDINIIIKSIISLWMFAIIVKYSPADTVKRPIISKKRRKVYKTLSSIFSMTLIIISTICNNYPISNLMLIGLCGAAIMIHPLTYKIFGMPYNNYKTYNSGLISN